MNSAHINLEPAAQAACAVLSADGSWLRANEAFCDLVGYTFEELQRLSHTQLVTPSERERIAAFLHSLGQHRFGPAKIETRFLRSDAVVVRAEVTARLVDGKDSVAEGDRFELLVEDIASRERQARLAHETAENFRLLLHNATEHAIIRIDDQGLVVSWNPGAQRILGYNEAEIVGRSSRIFFTPEDIASGVPQKELDMALEFGRAEDDRWQVRKDRTRFWASGVTTPFRNENGRTEGFVKVFCDLTDRKINVERALYLAHHDTLTGLPNRKKFRDDLEALIGRNGRANPGGVEFAATAAPSAQPDGGNTNMAVLLLDLDRFQTINDALGHHAGDQVLRSVAQRLTEMARPGDLLARLSGDEFGIVAPGIVTDDEAQGLASAVLSMMTSPILLGREQATISASIGIALYPRDADHVDQLLINADLAMHRAKRLGRSRHVTFSERLNDEASRRHALEEASRLALTRSEFHLHYQPQFSLLTGEICGIEALLRWNRPGMPVVGTGEFVALADETGLIVQLGEWVLRTACAQQRDWHDAGHEVVVSVNLSYRQIRENGFLNMLDRAIGETGADPRHLELEITEGQLMENTIGNMSLLHALKERGIRLSVDDFGTGFSSLSYLKHFPVDSLKIDQAFVRHLPDNRNDASIISAIIGLGHSMNLTVIAEGIENERQARFLRDRKCDCAQGYYFSKAVPAHELSRMLEEHTIRHLH